MTSLAVTSGYSHAETLQKLERLNQLETITAEQRIRLEKYRTMYETLKAEQEQTEEDKRSRDNEIHSLREELRNLQSRFQEVVSKTRTERDTKVAECEHLRMKVLTPQKMEVMKIKIQEDVEGPFKTKIESLELEVEKYRNEFNRLRYDYSFLKSEYEHEMAQKKTFFDEAQGKFEVEKESLKKHITSLTEELDNREPVDVNRLRSLQKDNTRLNFRLKSLQTELEELRDKKEVTNLQSDQTCRLQARQLSDITVQNKSLEAERDTMKLQYDRLQKELEKANKEQDQHNIALHKAEKENLQLKSQIEEMNHNKRMELNNLRVSLTKDRSELERERDALRVEINTMKSKTVLQENNIQDLKIELEAKERNLVKRVQLVREEEWEKLNKLESLKSQLETQIATLEEQGVDAQQTSKLNIEQLEDALKTRKNMLENCERDLLNTRTLLSQEKTRSKMLEKENEKLFEIKSNHQKLQHNYEIIINSDKEHKLGINKLEHEKEFLKKELERHQGDLKSQNEVYQQQSEETRKLCNEEISKLQKSYADLQQKHRDSKEKFEKYKQSSKKKIKKVKSDLLTATEQTLMLQSKENNHEIENQSLRKKLHVEQERMRRRMEKLRHRQQQFSHVLNSSNFHDITEISPGKRSSSSFLNDQAAAINPPVSNVSPIYDASHIQE